MPAVLLFWVIKFLQLFKRKDKRLKRYLVLTVFGILCFSLLTVVPLIWFDLRHNFINYKSFYKFFSERQTTVNLKIYKAIPNLWPLWRTLVTRLTAGKNEIFGFWLSLAFGLSIVIYAIFALLANNIRLVKRQAGFLIFFWLGMGLFGMGLYKQHIYDHYFGFLFPVIFLVLAVIMDAIFNLGKFGKFLFFLSLLIISYFSLKEVPLQYPPNFQMQRTIEVDKKIVKEAQGKRYNLGMIAKQNYDAGYRYFLEKWGSRTTEIDAQRARETITDQLFVVCEVQDCQPIGHPQAEIANFGWAKIEEEWDFPWGLKLFKLGHYQ